MTLDERQLNEFLGVLDRIDRGKAMPRFPDRMGRFLRQYKDGRLRIAAVLHGLGDLARSDGAVGGFALGRAEVHPLVEPKVGVLGFPLGEVADTLAVSEELGGVVNLIMWLKSPMANAAHEVLKRGSSVLLTGDYRWTPMARLAVGGAEVGSVTPRRWSTIRCIKAVADDLDRPPHALEYALDYRIGPPGIKFFRSICCVRQGGTLRALPAYGEPVMIAISNSSTPRLREVEEGGMCSLLAYREPWSADWIAVDLIPQTTGECFSHAVSWAGYQQELTGERIGGQAVAAIRASWIAARIPVGNDYHEFDTEHRLLPVVRETLRELRRL